MKIIFIFKKEPYTLMYFHVKYSYSGINLIGYANKIGYIITKYYYQSRFKDNIKFTELL